MTFHGLLAVFDEELKELVEVKYLSSVFLTDLACSCAGSLLVGAGRCWP